MSKEKLSNSQKKSIAHLKPKGRDYDDIAILTNTSVSTVRSKEKEGEYLIALDCMSEENRKLKVENTLLKFNPYNVFAEIEAQE